jgi:hypothetical protein
MLFNWFDAREAEEFGLSLALFFAERVSVDACGNDKKNLVKKRQDVLGKLFAQAERYKCEHKLNVYKKAKLGNTFKWKLKDMGYDAGYVNELTKELIVKL